MLELKDISGGTLVNTQRSHCRGTGSIPGQGTKVSCSMLKKKKTNTKLDIGTSKMVNKRSLRLGF